MHEEGLTIAEAAREVGRGQAAVRQWVQAGTLTKVKDRPAMVDASQIAVKRADHLALFEGVADLRLTQAAASSSGEEVLRLRSVLRAVLASVESFDLGVAQLRDGQRIVLDALLGTVVHVDPIEARAR